MLNFCNISAIQSANSRDKEKYALYMQRQDCSSMSEFDASISEDPQNLLNINNEQYSDLRCVCCVCGQTFSNTLELDSHLKMHKGQKFYVCDICQKSFLDKTNFLNHYRIHTGERPFICNICGKGFKQQIHLKVHFKIHTGEKPFKCHDCGYKTANSSDLKKHIKIRHILKVVHK